MPSLYDYQVPLFWSTVQHLYYKGWAYLAAKERVGKSAPALFAANYYYPNGSVLIITLKKAIKGWKEIMNIFEGYFSIKVELINYESIHKVKNTNPDIVIVDEAHKNISAYPDTGKTYTKVRAITYDKPLILLSATPHPKSFSQIFHPLQLTKYSPFKEFRDFYDFFAYYGIPDKKYIKAGYTIPSYDKTRPELEQWITPQLIVLDRKDLGFVEPVVNPIYIENLKITKELSKNMMDYRELVIDNIIVEAISPADEKQKIQQIEGGTLKFTKKYKIPTINGKFISISTKKQADELGLIWEDVKPETYKFFFKCAKLNYLLQNYPDSPDMVIMHNFILEKELLSRYYKKAKILQITANAFGVDLSQYKKLVIYSFNWRRDVFIQSMVRQANKDRKEAIQVDYLLAKNGVSEAMYKTLTEAKKSFTDSVYENAKKFFDF